MKHIVICLGIIAGFFGIGHALQTPDEVKKSELVLVKMRQIELLDQIVPLALTKDQINKLLPTIERARAKVMQIRKEEAVALAKWEGKLTEAIKNSEEKQLAPPKALKDELAAATILMSKKRLLAIDENTEALMKVFNEVCNAGQKKAAANSLGIQQDPSPDAEKLTDQDKIRVFVREILLDPYAYDLFVALQKHTG